MPTNKITPQINQEPVSEILARVRAAATVIAEQASLLTELFAEAQSHDPRGGDISPSPATGGDQLVPVTRVAQRWDCRHQAAWERLARAKVPVVKFGYNHFVRLSDLIALEARASAPVSYAPSRKLSGKRRGRPSNQSLSGKK